MYFVDYHSDDYASSLNASKRILELVREGRLNSISILPNMSCYEECMEYLKKNWDSLPNKPYISIHVNLVDGMSLSGKYRASSWGKLFLRSYIPGIRHAVLKNKLTDEIKAQIKRVYEDLPEGAGLRLDSHVHTHMIPIVFDAMLKAVEELGLFKKLEFVRVSKEPFLMFFTTGGVVGTFPLTNVIKNVILNFLSGRCIRKLKEKTISYGYILGLIMSGRMDKERIDRLAPKVISYMKKRDMYFEIVCHPGIVLKDENLDDFSEGDRAFQISENRNIEYDGALKRTGL